MRMLDVDREASVHNLQMYFSVKEAKDFREKLDRLLRKPEGFEHEHVFADDMHCEVSFSILTPAKLNDPNKYTPLERRILKKK